jgi:hypothetical protein
MTGSEHYDLAEKSLKDASNTFDLEEAKFHHDRAIAHATLAAADAQRRIAEALRKANR